MCVMCECVSVRYARGMVAYIAEIEEIVFGGPSISVGNGDVLQSFNCGHESSLRFHLLPSLGGFIECEVDQPCIPPLRPHRFEMYKRS